MSSTPRTDLLSQSIEPDPEWKAHAKQLESSLAAVTAERDIWKRRAEEREKPTFNLGRELEAARQRAEKAEAELAEATLGRCTCSGCNRIINNAWRNSDGHWCLTCLAEQLAEARKDSDRLDWLGKGGREAFESAYRVWNGRFREAIDVAMQKGAE